MGWLLANKVQMTRTLTLPSEREVCCSCQLQQFSEIYKELTEQEQRSGSGSLSTEPRELKAIMVICFYQPVEEDQIEGIDVRAKSVLLKACLEHVAQGPDHGHPLLNRQSLSVKWKTSTPSYQTS